MISQPSKLVYVVDVPEVKDFVATFSYNFFTPDESVNDTGGVPSPALSRPGANVDAAFIQWSLTRVPREVNFSFSLPKLADIGNVVSAQAQRDNANRTTGAQDGSLILRNIDKVINEDYFAINGFVAVNFHDGEIDNKIHYLVSGVLATQALESEHPDSTSHYKAAQGLTAVLPNTIKPHFVSRALTIPDLAYGAQFYLPPTSPVGATGGYQRPTTAVRFINSYYDRLKRVAVNAQINAKLLQGLIDKTIRDPTTSMAADVSHMHGFARSARQATNQRFSPAVAENDYKTFVPYIDIQKRKTALHHQKYGKEIVGFIIDKFEVLVDGTTVPLPPIVVDSPHVAMSGDFRVKFNTRYCYAIRTIAQLTLPAIDDNNGDVATVRVLISSKPSNKVYVQTTKFDAPPPPGDIDLVWNYETNKLLVTWAFPVWSQQDIKQFQVFRRSSLDHPFQLQKSYNFDDSSVKFPDNENPDPRLVEYLTSPCQFYVDDDFDATVYISEAKSFIYAVTCIDAHGLSSPLSAQYRVWFDPFKNKLQMQHVSHLGAPKSYPNLYLDGDVFVNTVKVSGPHSKQMKLYFNPEYYYLYDDQNRMQPVLATLQRGGSYQLQFINTDNGKSQSINVTIDDQLQANAKPLRTPQVTLGPKRRNSALASGIA
jgi:hypothetical protein